MLHQYRPARSCKTGALNYYRQERRESMLPDPQQATPPRVTRAAKFRQAAFVYLHVAILYEAAAYAMWRANMLPSSRLGPAWLWLILGGVVALAVFFALLRWQNVTFARVVWALHALRLPALVKGAFITSVQTPMPRSFYITAIVVVTINLWMLARAAWDL
jgi:hypothetical protein